MPNIYLSLVPLFSWALGDFFIQKSSRAMSGARTLFYLCVFSTFFFLPWVDVRGVFQNENFYFLIFTGIFGFIYAITLFQAFKIAKLSVVESVIAMELPLTVFLATTFSGETISSRNFFILSLIFIGILFTVSKENIFARITKHFKARKKMLLEKGFYLALASVTLSAVFNYLVGYSGLQSESTISAIWLIHIGIGVCTFIFMFFTREIPEIYHDIKTHPFIILFSSFFDTVAWAGYIFAVSKNNISTVTAVSEGYIALAAFLGFYFNKEKLIWTQKLGMVIVFVSTMLFVLNN